MAADETEHDTFWRPATRAIDILTSLGYGRNNMFNELAKATQEGTGKIARGQAPGWEELRQLNPLTGGIPDFVKGVGDAWTGNQKDLITGSDIIEQATDRGGRVIDEVRAHRGMKPLQYEDVEDNVNPWLKGIGGFGIDVANDPLTYVAGGVVTSGIRGGYKAGVKAAREAETAKSAAFFKEILTPGKTAKGIPLPVNRGGLESIRAWRADEAAKYANKNIVKAARAGLKRGENVTQNADTIAKLMPFAAPRYLKQYSNDPRVKQALDATDPEALAKNVSDTMAEGGAQAAEAAARALRGEEPIEEAAEAAVKTADGAEDDLARELREALEAVEPGKAGPPVGKAGPPAARTADEIVAGPVKLPPKPNPKSPKYGGEGGTALLVKDRATYNAAVRAKRAQAAIATAEAAKIIDDVPGLADDVASETNRIVDETIEDTVRGRIAATMGGPAALYAGNAATRSDDVQGFIKQMTYEKDAITVGVRKKILAVRPIAPALAKLPPAEAKKALSEWVAKVAELTGASPRVIRSEWAGLSKADLDLRLSEAATNMVEHNYKNLSDLLSALAAKKGVRAPKAEQVKELARMMGMKVPDDVDDTNIIDAFLRGNPKQEMTRIKQEQIAARKLYVHAGVPGGQLMEDLAAGFTHGEVVDEATRTFIATVESINPEHLALIIPAFGRALPEALGDLKKFKHTSTGARGETVIKTNKKAGKGRAIIEGVLEQRKTLTFAKELWKVNKAVTKGATGTKRQEALIEFFSAGMRYHDDFLRAHGIFPTVRRENIAGWLEGGKGLNYAFLGLSDVMATFDPKFLGAMMFAGSKVAAIPPSTLHQAAREALKLSSEPGITYSQALSILGEYIRRDIGRQVVKSTGELSDSAKFAASARGEQVVSGLAAMLLDPARIKALSLRNIENGAKARAVLGEVAGKVSQPIIDGLRMVINSPTSSKGDIVEAITGAVEKLRKAVHTEGLTGTEAGIIARHDFEIALAQMASNADIELVRASLRMDAATKVGKSGRKLAPEEATRKMADATARAGGIDSKGQPKRAADPVRTEASEAAFEGALKASNKARKDEVVSVHERMDEILTAGRQATNELGIGGDIVAIDKVHAQLSMGLPWWLKAAERIGEKMSGNYGMRESKAFEIQQAVSSRQQIHLFAQALQAIRTKHGLMENPELAHQAWNVLRTLPDNASLDTVLESIEPATAALARDLWPVMSRVFDHSEHSLFARSGLSAKHINASLRGVPKAYTLGGPSGREMGWEVARQWTRWEAGVGDEFLNDPLELLMKYQAGLQRASVVPSIAATFSAQFGHTSSMFGPPMTAAEAVAKGYKRVDPKSGPLAQFVDPDEFFPPQFIEEMARMQNYFSTSRILDNSEAFFDRAFRNIDPIVNIVKASVTIWRPGHHVTNIMGEFLFNTLAGVWNMARYADAFNVLKSQGHVAGDVGDKITRYLAENAPEGVVLKASDNGKGVLVPINGEPVLLSYDSAFRMLDNAGIVIHHNVAEDLVNESAELLLNSSSKFSQAAHKAQSALAPAWLGNISASRDNLFRLAHAIDIMSKGSFRSMDDMVRQVGKEVNAFHPNMQTLSAFEQKYVRRVLYFYTWQRQALTKIMESMIEAPGRVTMAPKALYNASEANGVEPQSFGEPMPNDPRLPSFVAGNQTSVLFNESQRWGDGGEETFLWGASMNAPQLDILQSVFGGVKVNPNKAPNEQGGDLLAQAWQTVGAMASPAMRVPAELLTGHEAKTGIEVKNVPEYLLDQTGLGYASRAELFGPRSDRKTNENEAQANIDRTLANWGGGLKITNFTTPGNQKRAYADRAKELQRLFESEQ